MEDRIKSLETRVSALEQEVFGDVGPPNSDIFWETGHGVPVPHGGVVHYVGEGGGDEPIKPRFKTVGEVINSESFIPDRGDVILLRCGEKHRNFSLNRFPSIAEAPPLTIGWYGSPANGLPIVEPDDYSAIRLQGDGGRARLIGLSLKNNRLSGTRDGLRVIANKPETCEIHLQHFHVDGFRGNGITVIGRGTGPVKLFGDGVVVRDCGHGLGHGQGLYLENVRPVMQRVVVLNNGGGVYGRDQFSHGVYHQYSTLSSIKSQEGSWTAVLSDSNSAHAAQFRCGAKVRGWFSFEDAVGLMFSRGRTDLEDCVIHSAADIGQATRKCGVEINPCCSFRLSKVAILQPGCIGNAPAWGLRLGNSTEAADDVAREFDEAFSIHSGRMGSVRIDTEGGYEVNPFVIRDERWLQVISAPENRTEPRSAGSGSVPGRDMFTGWAEETADHCLTSPEFSWAGVGDPQEVARTINVDMPVGGEVIGRKVIE